MKAILYPRYGGPDVLRLSEVDKPAPEAGRVLIKVHAASINSLDWHFMRGSPFLIRVTGNGLGRPKDPRLGVDVAGTVEAVGAGVTQFQPGDEVFGRGAGSFAEYACAKEDAIVLKPATLTFGQAAAVPIAALTALAGLRDRGQLRPGQRVLINGASGGVGSFAVQIAKALGGEVTAVCGARNLEQARTLGAERVIDYAREDVTRSNERFDLVVAINGYHPLLAYRRILSPRGTFVFIGGDNARLMRALLQAMTLGPLLSREGGQRLGGALEVKPTPQDLAFVSELLEAGKIRPVIDRCYPLSETAAAFRYFEDEHARGKVVITMVPDRAAA
jgi:NADPH:quinone reductase-like Zn-dependent oxidoreductase